MLSWPLVMSASIMGMRKGETRPGPFARIVSYSATRVVMPPMAVPMMMASSEPLPGAGR
ncbi:hypothetical protein O0235_02525 [Tepidiforma flava]|uniref:Uncharacterized protein n=1 Tax=Tepidiforma flava TaxID=3004094 RepID=A0ABY7M8I6_9CHLR|nr:hypothetical protein [Tepidiforma flava]WBL36462.1 hypothetical protein O0235_02525 [Tepidiforma flava]